MNFQEYSSLIEFNYDLIQRLRREEEALEERQKKLREIYSKLLFKRPSSFPTNIEALKVSELSSLMESFEKAGFVLPEEEKWIENEFKGDYFEYELNYSNFFPIKDFKVYPNQVPSSQDQVHTLNGRLALIVYLEGKLSKKGKCISPINPTYYLSGKNKGKNLLTSSSPQFPKYMLPILKIEDPVEIGQFAFGEHHQVIDSLESLVKDIQTERKKVYFSFLSGGR